jgi:hypothetical protein
MVDAGLIFLYCDYNAKCKHKNIMVSFEKILYLHVVDFTYFGRTLS